MAAHVLLANGHWASQLTSNLTSCQDLTLYLVWDSEGVAETTDEVVEDLFTAMDGADSEDDNVITTKKKKDKKGKKKAKSSSDSEDAGSQEGSGESSSSKVWTGQLCVHGLRAPHSPMFDKQKNHYE